MEIDPEFKHVLKQESVQKLRRGLDELKRTTAPAWGLSINLSVMEGENNPHAIPFLETLPDLSEFDGKVLEFKCSGIGLTSLEGLPKGIETIIANNNLLKDLRGVPDGVSHIECSHNFLTSLMGLPDSVLLISAHNNQLTTLKGLPRNVDVLLCNNNSITSLLGIPSSCRQLDVSHNKLTSLDGLQNNHKLDSLHCSSNLLTSLEGLPVPSHLTHSFTCRDNPGNFTEEDIKNAKRGIFAKKLQESKEFLILLKRYLLNG